MMRIQDGKLLFAMPFTIALRHRLPEPGRKMVIRAGAADGISSAGGNLALGHAMQCCDMPWCNAYHQPGISDFHQHNPLALTDSRAAYNLDTAPGPLLEPAKALQ
jgi:hypothetical protein